MGEETQKFLLALDYKIDGFTKKLDTLDARVDQHTKKHQKAEKEIVTSWKRTEHQLEQARHSIEKMGEPFEKLEGVAKAAAGFWAVHFGRELIAEAAEAARAHRQFVASVGEGSHELEEILERQAHAFGFVGAEVLGYSAKIAQYFKNTGFATEETAALSEQVSSLALDLATLYGGNPADFADKLRMGMLGSARALRDYNVQLKDGIVNQELAAMGFANIGEGATSQQIALARLISIQKQLDYAVGANVKSMGTMGDAQRRLSTGWTEAKEAMGGFLAKFVIGMYDMLTFTTAYGKDRQFVEALNEQIRKQDEFAQKQKEIAASIIDTTLAWRKRLSEWHLEYAQKDIKTFEEETAVIRDNLQKQESAYREHVSKLARLDQEREASRDRIQDKSFAARLRGKNPVEQQDLLVDAYNKASRAGAAASNAGSPERARKEYERSLQLLDQIQSISKNTPPEFFADLIEKIGREIDRTYEQQQKTEDAAAKAAYKNIEDQKAIMKSYADVIEQTKERVKELNKELANVGKEMRAAAFPDQAGDEGGGSGAEGGEHFDGGGTYQGDTQRAPWIRPGETITPPGASAQFGPMLEAIRRMGGGGSSVVTIGDVHVTFQNESRGRSDGLQIARELRRDIQRGLVGLSAPS